MKTITHGDRGSSVQKLSEKLMSVGLLDSPTSTFNDQMELAIRAWQTHGVDHRGRKLQVDGVAGPLTWSSFDVNTNLTFSTPVPESFYSIPSEGGSVLGRTALRFALGEMRLDAREIGGNNQGPFVDKYHRQDMDERQWAWCAAFTSWCFLQASKMINQDMPFEYTVGAQDLHKQLAAADMAYDASDDNPPQPGDICVWWRGATRTWKGHVGIVWGYQNGIVYVIEGNVGPYPARVRVFDYVLGRINKLIGFARPEVPLQMCAVEGESNV